MWDLLKTHHPQIYGKLHAHDIHTKINCFDSNGKKGKLQHEKKCGAKKQSDVFMKVISDTLSWEYYAQNIVFKNHWLRVV